MIRGALTAIPPGQVEAAQALAIPRRWIWLRIILPQVAVLVVPPLTVELAALVAGSALLSVVGVVELTRSAQQIIAVTFEPLGTWAKVAFLYFLMCFALGQLTRQLQRLKTTGLAVHEGVDRHRRLCSVRLPHPAARARQYHSCLLCGNVHRLRRRHPGSARSVVEMADEASPGRGVRRIDAR